MRGARRGTPRLANRLLKRVRDFAQVRYDGRITKAVADATLSLLEVDRLRTGCEQTAVVLTADDREVLRVARSGLDTLAAAHRARTLGTHGGCGVSRT